MSKSTSQSRRQRNPHTHEEQQPEKTDFFSKASEERTSQKKTKPFFQAKLAIGPANDSYEQEADHVANKVVNDKSATPVLKQQKVSSVQKLATPVEDEKLGTNDARMAKDKEIQEKPLQRATAPEKEKMNDAPKMEAPEKEKKEVQKKEAPVKEEEDKTKTPAVQAKQDGGPSTASQQVSSRIQNSAGKGSALPKKTLKEMNASFGTDFSNVRIHNDNEAASLNKELQAQAFTHGSDIYFNAGKFSPENAEGKFLLAHELTHVIQQNKKEDQALNTGGKVQRETEEVVSGNENSSPKENAAQSCSGWESDPQSFSKRAAENFCKDAFNVAVGSPDSISCSGNSCIVAYSNGPFKFNITVDLSQLPGTVSVSGSASPFILRPQLCTYRYSCDDTGTIGFTRTGCRIL